MINILPKHKIENWSGSIRVEKLGLPTISSVDYVWHSNYTLSGDAPKGFLSIYSFNKNSSIRKKSPKTWAKYIVKTGHKWYPNESITEHLLNRLGTIFGLQMAQSGLVIINGQLRFISKYFLHYNREELVHGAEIFAGYLEDSKMVEDIEAAHLSQNLFTLQFVKQALQHAFPKQSAELLHQLVQLLLFDAFVGNNDRHYYNWAVINSYYRNTLPKFSPVYDTARGLFWNNSDMQLEQRFRQGNIQHYLEKYCQESRPKIGWEGVSNINHFNLVRLIFTNNFAITKQQLSELFNQQLLPSSFEVIDSEFSKMMSQRRRELIKQCLEYRFNTIRKIIENE